ncbi:MAG TPA: T9SS type A sorting domain-containing protein, partial [Flavobacteriales bacterium]|nr:T9SS type A sorting domain-containing protein [Flavobacteriales bacterium]
SLAANGTRHAWYSGDTLVGGLTAQRIEQRVDAFQTIPPFGTPVSFVAPTLFTATVGDRVMLWNDQAGAYDTLMWFGAHVGDHWDPPHFPGPARFDVIDTGNTTVSAIPLHYIVVQELGTGWVDTLRERIGFDYFYIDPNESFIIDFTTTWLQCYRDNVIAEYHGNTQQGSCDFTTGVAEVRSTTWSLYPNPGTDQLELQLPEQVRSVEVLDALGRCVLRAFPTGTRTTVHTASLSTGSYIIRVRDRADVVTTQRWMKE